MQMFTPEEVAEKRKAYIGYGWPVIQIPWTWQAEPPEELVFDCFLVPASVIPKTLPNAVMRVTPSIEVFRASKNRGRDAFFGISDGVPEKFRPFVVGHEIVEFLEFGQDCKGRCAKSAEREIARVQQAPELSPSDRDSYLRMRQRFFGDLIEYAKSQPQHYTPEDLAEFQGSLGVFDMVLTYG